METILSFDLFFDSNFIKLLFHLPLTRPLRLLELTATIAYEMVMISQGLYFAIYQNANNFKGLYSNYLGHIYNIRIINLKE